MNKNCKILWALSVVLLSATSCQKSDSQTPWGNAIIYMPQANYSPYVVPNSGSQAQTNLNYSIDKDNNAVNIFLGVYRSGLSELNEYRVDVNSGTTKLMGTTLLPSAHYLLPLTVTCPAGKRDATFYLTVDLDYLQANRLTVFSIPVSISNPTLYTLNEDLSTTTIKINTQTLLDKESL
ncbi:MAG: DUF1735 domain-containing protein [Tidjanibacter sp.]|nr:DUF1735 domain-containing protein [Tidjanibacter sp.]